MNLKAIINLFSILVLLFSLSYVFPIVVSLVFNDNSLYLFLPTFIFVGALGLIGFFFTKGVQRDLSAKDGFVIIVMFWLVLSLAGSIPFYLSGMSPIDSFFESMSGITTTGATVISNIETLPESLKFYRQLLQWMGGMGLSIGHFNNLTIEIICMVFMLLSAMSFALHYFSIYKSKSLKYFYDPELKFFVSILLIIFILALSINILLGQSNLSLRELAFHTVSTVTTTGFGVSDTSTWSFSISFLLLIGAFVGACSGSVGGGVKSWRVMIMLNHAYSNIVKMIHPNSVVTLKVGTKSVDDNVATSVWGFFSIYVISFVILLLAVLISGLDLETAFSSVGACLNNLGPGLGMVSDNYSEINSFAKGVLAFSMLLGRLEIFTLLIILTPMFWAK